MAFGRVTIARAAFVKYNRNGPAVGRARIGNSLREATLDAHRDMAATMQRYAYDGLMRKLISKRAAARAYAPDLGLRKALRDPRMTTYSAAGWGFGDERVLATYKRSRPGWEPTSPSQYWRAIEFGRGPQLRRNLLLGPDGQVGPIGPKGPLWVTLAHGQRAKTFRTRGTAGLYFLRDANIKLRGRGFNRFYKPHFRKHGLPFVHLDNSGLVGKSQPGIRIR